MCVLHYTGERERRSVHAEHLLHLISPHIHFNPFYMGILWHTKNTIKYIEYLPDRCRMGFLVATPPDISVCYAHTVLLLFFPVSLIILFMSFSDIGLQNNKDVVL